MVKYRLVDLPTDTCSLEGTLYGDDRLLVINDEEFMFHYGGVVQILLTAHIVAPGSKIRRCQYCGRQISEGMPYVVVNLLVELDPKYNHHHWDRVCAKSRSIPQLVGLTTLEHRAGIDPGELAARTRKRR